MVVPKLMVYKGKSQQNMDENWGYPHLWKPPSLSYFSVLPISREDSSCSHCSLNHLQYHLQYHSHLLIVFFGYHLQYHHGHRMMSPPHGCGAHPKKVNRSNVRQWIPDAPEEPPGERKSWETARKMLIEAPDMGISWDFVADLQLLSDSCCK